MMIKLTESKKILLKRVLIIPNLIRHSDEGNTTLKTAIKMCDEYNEMLNDGDLESALEHLPYADSESYPLCRRDVLCIKMSCRSRTHWS